MYLRPSIRQVAKAGDFFAFSSSANPSMLKLNESTVPYAALGNIPIGNKVKVIFPQALDLFQWECSGAYRWSIVVFTWEWYQVVGPSQRLLFPVSSLDSYDAAMIDAEESIGSSHRDGHHSTTPSVQRQGSLKLAI